MTLLVADRLALEFGGVAAVDDVSFAVERGEILAIIGPNGAGKTTLFNLLCGLLMPRRGRVTLDGEDVTGQAPYRLARLGLSRTFQNLNVFVRMSAVENVMVGRHLHEHRSVLSHLRALPAVRKQNRATRHRAKALLAQVGLRELADRPAGTLAYGALKRLEIARALATEPKILLLDEPAAGCNPVETSEIDAIIRDIARTGVAVMLVEHDMRLVMNVSDRILVLANGCTLAEGTAAEVRADPAVIEAYLGVRRAQETTHAVGSKPEERLWPDRGAARRVDRGGRGGERCPGRSQRRRQDHPDAGDFRRSAGLRRAHSLPRATDRKTAGACARRARHRPGAGRPAGVRTAVGRRQSPARRVDAADGRIRIRPGLGLRLVPDAGRQAARTRRRAVGRATTDARRGPRSDGKAAAPPARRTVDGPRADPGRPDPRHDCRAEAGRAHGAAGRAERAGRADHRRSRLCPGDRAHHRGRTRRRTARRRSRTIRLSRNMRGYAWKPTLQTGLDAERRGENGSARGCTPFRYQAARRILSRRSLSGLPGAARARSRPPDAGRIIFSQPLRPLRGGLSRSRDMELGQESGLQAEFRRQLAVRTSHHQPGFQ